MHLAGRNRPGFKPHRPAAVGKCLIVGYIEVAAGKTIDCFTLSGFAAARYIPDHNAPESFLALPFLH